MAQITKNLGQGGSSLTAERGDGNDVRSILLSILTDMTNTRADLALLLTAVTDLDTDGSHGISLPTLTASLSTTKED